MHAGVPQFLPVCVARYAEGAGCEHAAPARGDEADRHQVNVDNSFQLELPCFDGDYDEADCPERAWQRTMAHNTIVDALCRFLKDCGMDGVGA